MDTRLLDSTPTIFILSQESHKLAPGNTSGNPLPHPMVSFKKIMILFHLEELSGLREISLQRPEITGNRNSTEEKASFGSCVSQDLNLALALVRFSLLFICEMGVRIDEFHGVPLVWQILSIPSLNLYSKPVRCRRCHPQFTDGKKK